MIGVGYGLADGYLKSRPYLDLEAPSLRPLALIVAVVVLFTLAGVAVTASPAARRKLTGILATRAVSWLPAAAAALAVLIFVGFAVRPLVQTVGASETDPTSIAYVAELQKLAGLPVNGRDQYYQDSLYWVIWYLGVPHRAARRLRPRGPRPAVHQSAAHLERPQRRGPGLGAAGHDRDLGGRDRAVAARGRPGSAIGPPAAGPVRAARPDPGRHLGRDLAQGPGRPSSAGPRSRRA